MKCTRIIHFLQSMLPRTVPSSKNLTAKLNISLMDEDEWLTFLTLNICDFRKQITLVPIKFCNLENLIVQWFPNFDMPFIFTLESGSVVWKHQFFRNVMCFQCNSWTNDPHEQLTPTQYLIARYTKIYRTTCKLSWQDASLVINEVNCQKTLQWSLLIQECHILGNHIKNVWHSRISDTPE
jgi:hypothetical protein